MSEREALIEGIREYDPDAMLVLADWLEEYGGGPEDEQLRTGLRWCADNNKHPAESDYSTYDDHGNWVNKGRCWLWSCGRSKRGKAPHVLPPLLYHQYAAGPLPNTVMSTIRRVGKALLEIWEVTGAPR